MEATFSKGRQKQIGECFLKHKKAIHEKEDPEFLQNMSDVLDMRNWNMSAFDPALDENKEEETIEKEVENMLEKLKSSEKFYEDLEKTTLESEFNKILRLIYENEKECELWTNVRKENHIIDQWQYLNKRIPFMSENDYSLWFRIIKRGTLAPNAQTRCERANSTYNLFKTKLSVRMQLPMIKARLRIKINGPPTSMFKPAAVHEVWLKNGHQYATTITKTKVVIDRIRKEDNKKHTSKIFD